MAFYKLGWRHMAVACGVRILHIGALLCEANSKKIRGLIEISVWLDGL